MNRLAVLSLTLAACTDEHHVTVLLGPNEQELSRGFTCVQSDAGIIPTFDEYLIYMGFVTENPGPLPRGRLEFNIVIDFLTLGDGVPTCRGEDIAAWCEERGGCGQIFVEDRFCAHLRIEGVDTADLTTEAGRERFRLNILQQAYAQLEAAGDVTLDAPDGTVIVRAVGTTQDCAALTQPITGDHYIPFDTGVDSTTLLGCAYSCPVLLDAVKGVVELTLDGTGVRCEPEVRACAGDLQAISSDLLLSGGGRAPR